jgi:hypothetical protein
MRSERVIAVLRTVARVLTEVVPLVTQAVIDVLQRLKQKS